MLLTSAKRRCDTDFLIRAPDSKDVQLNAQSWLHLTDSHLLALLQSTNSLHLLLYLSSPPPFSMKEAPALYL